MAILSFGWGQGNDRPDCTESLAAQLARLAEQVLPPGWAPRGLREKVAVGEGLSGEFPRKRSKAILLESHSPGTEGKTGDRMGGWELGSEGGAE